jgi:hypothetical protein
MATFSPGQQEARLAASKLVVPRIGIRFRLPAEMNQVAYFGRGPGENYIDRQRASHVDLYKTTAEAKYTNNYVRPQENGSHYASEYLRISGAFSVTAEKPFSFSVLPFTSAQLFDCKHAYELKRKGITSVCIDLAMRGGGTHSCGTELAKEFEVPQEGENEFTLIFE